MRLIIKWQAHKKARLASFLQERWKGSGKAIRRILSRNGCRINGKVERFASALVREGDWVEFYPFEVPSLPWDFPPLYEGADFRIVGKPAGWVCSEAQCSKTFGRNAFLVHRLDKETTGALLLAGTRAIQEELMHLFALRAIEKEYIALVDGIPKEMEGTRQSRLQKKGVFQGQTLWGSGKRGSEAITHWKILAISPEKNASLLLCRPETGRTHQIRVHLAEMGHPLLIDRQYAQVFRSSLFAPRSLLHAARLSFSFRSQHVDVTAPWPGDLKEVLDAAGIRL